MLPCRLDNVGIDRSAWTSSAAKGEVLLIGDSHCVGGRMSCIKSKWQLARRVSLTLAFANKDDEQHQFLLGAAFGQLRKLYIQARGQQCIVINT
jgi:hypothetical protein